MLTSELETLRAKIIAEHTKGINTRQWILKMWLEKNQVKGKYFSIEEICEQVTYNGEHLYTLNKNPRIHDKCLQLSDDVREINWNVVDGYKIIIKDSKGGIKLCESQEEFDSWYNDEMATIEIKYQYLNTIKQKAKWDGVVPLINKANNPVKKYEPIDVFVQFDDEEMLVNTDN